MENSYSIKNKHCSWLPLNFFGRGRIEKIKKRTVDLIEDFIGEKEKVIDIGAGGGWISDEIQKRKKTKNLLLDVINLNQTELPLTLYDGKNIPFDENNFDSALLICVLHHCQDPLKVLEEAKRTVKKRIIIIEDIASTPLGKVALKIKDSFLNIAFSLLACSLKEVINLPFNFKTIPEWEKTFENLNLKLVYKKEYSTHKFSHYALFVVEKC